MADEQQDLRELLATAQTALEEGRHQEATVACRHVLRDYPESVTAMRLLGESYLEAGRADEAVRAFEKVLGIDPFNVLARVGLGVLAEDRGEDERAIAQFRLAWEVAPTLPQLRSELIRLYRKRYGVGGRLRMTRLALANLHAQNEDLPRAIRQFRQLLDEEPGRPDVAIGLAEVLWRHGEDDDAAGHCRSVLAERPRLVRPSLILAAIQGDEVAGEAATDLLAIVRGFDPDAAIARDLLALQPSRTLARFVDEPVAMTPFDPATLDIAGTDELLGVQTGSLRPESFRWEDVADGLTGESALHPDPDVTPATTSGLASAPADDDDVEALFAAIDRQLSTVDIDEQLPVFTMPDDEELSGAADAASADEPLADWDTEQDDPMAPSPDEPTAVERLTANWDNIDNELAAARPSDDAPIGVTGMLGGAELDLKPFDVESDAEPEAEETITFDPAKFSLPPLDGDDDDDLDLGLASDDLGADIVPFSLDEAGPKARTNGLTFSELVRKEEQTPTAALPEGQFTDILGDEMSLDTLPSIFATRELAPLPEDRLLDTQALPPDEMPQDVPVAAPQSLDATALLGTLPLEQQQFSDGATAAGPPSGMALARDAAVSGQEAGESEPKQARTFAELLDQRSSRRAAPGEAHSPAGTRPLLAPDDLDAPDGPAESEAGQLFDRLRNSKPERAETGALQLEPGGDLPGVPAVSPAASAEPAPDPGAEAADGDRFESVTMDGPVLDDWLMSLAPTDGEAQGSTEARTPRDSDDWLADYALPATNGADDYTPLAAADAVFDRGVSDTTWGHDTNSDHAPLAGDDPAPSWSAMAPDEPTPIVGRLARDEPRRVEAVPVWSAELPSTGAVGRESPAASAVHGHTAHRNGSVDEQQPVAAPVRTAVAREPERPMITAHDLDEQRAILESLVEADPSNQFARLTLAVAYSGSDPNRALNEYRRLIKESDDLVPEIIERLKEMVADGDAPVRTHRVLGDAYMKLGHFDLAMAEFQRALTSRLRPRG